MYLCSLTAWWIDFLAGPGEQVVRRCVRGHLDGQYVRLSPVHLMKDPTQIILEQQQDSSMYQHIQTHF